MEYYQLGGFSSTVRAHPMYSLAEKVYEALRKQQHPYDGRMDLQLLLGIAHSGTSHLLITRGERDAIFRESRKVEDLARFHLNRLELKAEEALNAANDAMERTLLEWQRVSFGPADLKSLSTISFANVDELLAKLRSFDHAGKAAAHDSPANEALRDAPPSTGLPPGCGQVEIHTDMKKVARDHFERLKLKDKKRQQEAKEAMERTFLRWRYNVCFTSLHFESVSTIPFANIGELSVKLESLQPGRKAAVDNSPANKAFQVAALGIGRGQFENSRLFYQVLQSTMPIPDRKLCALGDTSWTSSIRVFSFCYNTWTSDTRPLQDRKSRPRLLDIGWCEAAVPSLEGEHKMPRHIVIQENQQLINCGKKDRYEYGETEICSIRIATQRVQAVFGKYAQPTPHPAILLVHNVETALTVLSNIGVDVSHWDLRLANLLRSTDSPNPPTRGGSQRPVSAHARSASPGRGDYPSRKPATSRRYAPIYVVDLKTLFTTLLGIQPAAESVPEICKRLGLYKPTGWCAGNECWMLVDVFRRMAAGRNIDAQGLDWPQLDRTTLVIKDGVESESEYGDSDDEE
ncbi:hypothetical protein DFH06DRAFT_1479404 [Mycena polygramma]|nr:hypothetical protein DFH06DRAFT_1479404 [Mycena polygramma]